MTVKKTYYTVYFVIKFPSEVTCTSEDFVLSSSLITILLRDKLNYFKSSNWKISFEYKNLTDTTNRLSFKLCHFSVPETTTSLLKSTKY